MSILFMANSYAYYYYYITTHRYTFLNLFSKTNNVSYIKWKENNQFQIICKSNIK